MFTNHIYLIYINKPGLALNNLQWLICHKTKPNQTPMKNHQLKRKINFNSTLIKKNYQNDNIKICKDTVEYPGVFSKFDLLQKSQLLKLNYDLDEQKTRGRILHHTDHSIVKIGLKT